MKDIKLVLLNRRSYREYNNKEVDVSIIKEAIEIAQRTANSVNGQQISVVLSTDKEVLNKIAEVNWGQQHIKDASAFITFVVDYNRSGAVIEKVDKEIIIQNDIESILVGAVDAGLISQSIELLLQSQGIGTCQIGGIRQNIIKMNEILNIKGNAFAVLGMTIGYEDNFENTKTELRPRVELDSFMFKEKYNIDKVKEGALNYDNVLNEWWDSKGLSNHRSYTDSMSSFYTQYYMANEFNQLQQIGFLNKYENKK